MLFYIVTPIWVLRARSVASQAAGLVLPIGIYFVLLVWGLVDAGASSLSRAISIAQPALLLMTTMVYAVVLYMLVWSRDADASLTQTDDA